VINVPSCTIVLLYPGMACDRSTSSSGFYYSGVKISDVVNLRCTPIRGLRFPVLAFVLVLRPQVLDNNT